MPTASRLPPCEVHVTTETTQATPPEPEAAAEPAATEQLPAVVEAEKARRKHEIELHKLRAAVEERNDLLRLLAQDPAAFFEKTGFNFDEIASKVSKRAKPGPLDQVNEKVAKLEQELAERRAREEEAYYASLENKLSTDINEFLQKNAIKYEFASASPDAVSLMMEVLQDTYDKTGQIDFESAASKVEAYLETLTDRLSKANKFSKYFQQTNPSGGTAPPPKTLTNSASTTAPTRDTGNSNGPLSREESIARAARLLKFGTQD